MAKKIEVKMSNLSEALKDNDEKILIADIYIGNTPPDEVDDYMERIVETISNTKGLEDYEILFIPFRDYKERSRITKIKESELNKAGWFDEKK